MSERIDSAVILGVYGKGNFGDEALLEVVANDMRQVLPSCEFYVFCSGPEAVRERFGFHALTRTPATDFRRKLSASAAQQAGGGRRRNALVRPRWRPAKTPLRWSLSFSGFWLARLFGVPTVLYGQGFGPARGRFIRLGLWLVRFACTEVTVRDAASYDLLIGIAGGAHDSGWARIPWRPPTGTYRARCGNEWIRFSRARIDALRPFVVLAVRYPKLDTLDDSREQLEAVAARRQRRCASTPG